MATMTKDKAIKILREMSDKALDSAKVEKDLGRRCVLIGTANVLSRVEWDLSDDDDGAVAIAFNSACMMDTADRDCIPSDVWNWMSDMAVASS